LAFRHCSLDYRTQHAELQIWGDDRTMTAELSVSLWRGDKNGRCETYSIP
jgi:hypothetical protein